jgi:hypothetical protein
VTFDVSASEVVTAKGRFVSGTPAANSYRELISLTWQANTWGVTTMLPQV